MWPLSALIVLLLACGPAEATSPRSDAAQHGKGDDGPSVGEPLVVVARLADRGRRVPACGRAHFVVVMRYEVVSVVEGTLEGKDLFVAQSCPDMGWGPKSSPFRVGETYRLSLRPFLASDAKAVTLTDAFASDKRPRFVATSIAHEPTSSPQQPKPSKQP